jgi:hypothetical protein
VDADADREPDVVFVGEAEAERRHRLEDCQPLAPRARRRPRVLRIADDTVMLSLMNLAT